MHPADYGMLTMGGRGLLTPYGGFSLAGRDGRNYRAGARLETDTFNLSLEGMRSERGSGSVDHGDRAARRAILSTEPEHHASDSDRAGPFVWICP